MVKNRNNLTRKANEPEKLRKKFRLKRKKKKIFLIEKDYSKKNFKNIKEEKKIHDNLILPQKKIEEKISDSVKNSQVKPDSKSIFRDSEEEAKKASYLENLYEYLLNFLSSEFENSMKILVREELEQFLDLSESKKNGKTKYNLEDRFEAILIIRKEAEKILETSCVPKSFLFSVIALGDYYLEKTEEKNINGKKVKEIFFSAAHLIGKDLKVKNFNSSDYLSKFLNKDVLIERVKEIIMTVDAIFYPVKAYDFFERFFIFLFKKLTSTEGKECNDFMKEFWLKFYYQYHKILFYFLLNKNEEEETKKPSFDFFSCFLLVCEKFRNVFCNHKPLFEIINDFVLNLKKSLQYPLELIEKAREKVEEIMPSDDKYYLGMI